MPAGAQALALPRHGHPLLPAVQGYDGGMTTARGSLGNLEGKAVSTTLFKNITTGEAIEHVLDAAGFPAHLRHVDAGEVTLAYWMCNDRDADALVALRRRVTAEGPRAELYGSLRFRSRPSDEPSRHS